MQVFFYKELNNKDLRILFIMFFILFFIFSLANQVNAAEIVISSPVSTKPSPELPTEVEPKESNISDFIEKILELKPKSSSGIYTIVIFIILSLLMLYLKFRKGNTNNE